MGFSSRNASRHLQKSQETRSVPLRYADGSERFLSLSVDPQALEAMTTTAGGATKLYLLASKISESSCSLPSMSLRDENF